MDITRSLARTYVMNKMAEMGYGCVITYLDYLNEGNTTVVNVKCDYIEANPEFDDEWRQARWSIWMENGKPYGEMSYG